jgi:hypothetical protein
MMKNKSALKFIANLITSIITVYLLSVSGCASRESKPITLSDSTIFYPGKFEKVIFKGISLSNKLSKKTGEPVKPGTIFKLDDKAKLIASIDNIFSKSEASMIHIDWIDSEGNSFFRKRLDISPEDSVSLISSAISISTQKRDTGYYSVRFYLFRELFAEKKFQLVDSATYSKLFPLKDKPKSEKQLHNKITKKKVIKSKTIITQVKADLILCKKLSKKTGKPIGVDSIFVIGEKANIKAVVNIEKSQVKADEQMKFYFEWIGPDNKTFYKKKVEYSTGDSSFTISNSISISPEKRQPGIYTLQIIFRKKRIAEQKFELTAQTKPDSLKSGN